MNFFVYLIFRWYMLCWSNHWQQADILSGKRQINDDHNNNNNKHPMNKKKKTSKTSNTCVVIILHFIVAHYDNKSEIILILITRDCRGECPGTPSEWVPTIPGASNDNVTTEWVARKRRLSHDGQKMANNGNVRNWRTGGYEERPKKEQWKVHNGTKIKDE